MKKKTILVITIIITVLSIAFSILSYFGIIRYLNMYYASNKNLVKNYRNLPSAFDDLSTNTEKESEKHQEKHISRNIVISFTSKKSRLEYLKPMINSILDQTVKVNKIIFVKPKDIDDKNIPKYIKDICNIFPSGKDYRDGMNIIPSLLMEKEKDSVIIGIKDDFIYGKDFIETVVSKAEKHPDSLLIDTKKSCVIFSPECFMYNITDSIDENSDISWFVQRAKRNYNFTYSENYKSFI